MEGRRRVEGCESRDAWWTGRYCSWRGAEEVWRSGRAARQVRYVGSRLAVRGIVVFKRRVRVLVCVGVADHHVNAADPRSGTAGPTIDE